MTCLVSRAFLLLAAILTVTFSLARADAPVPGGAAAGASTKPAAATIGFVIPVAENEWYQLEWKFADEAAKKCQFNLVKLVATDGERTLEALERLAAQNAKGVIICAPDVRLGPAIAAAAKRHNMKLMSVDDQLIDAQGKALADVPHVGIDATAIGKQVGEALAAEMKKRGWKNEETAALGITFDVLETSQKRTDGAKEVLETKGFPKGRIFMVPRTSADMVGAFNAADDALAAHPGGKNWLVFSANDDGVIGAIRAMEGKGFKAENIIGVGVDATTAAQNEFEKKDPTGFVASILLQPRLHGYITAEAMDQWIAEGKEPAKLTQNSGVLVTRENYKKEIAKAMGTQEAQK